VLTQHFTTGVRGVLSGGESAFADDPAVAVNCGEFDAVAPVVAGVAGVRWAAFVAALEDAFDRLSS
jgi:hypothetical protein